MEGWGRVMRHSGIAHKVPLFPTCPISTVEEAEGREGGQSHETLKSSAQGSPASHNSSLWHRRSRRPWDWAESWDIQGFLTRSPYFPQFKFLPSKKWAMARGVTSPVDSCWTVTCALQVVLITSDSLRKTWSECFFDLLLPSLTRMSRYFFTFHWESHTELSQMQNASFIQNAVFLLDTMLPMY